MHRISKALTSNEKNTQLADLPPEALARVLSFLPLEAISKLSRTNKAFSALINSEEIYKWLKWLNAPIDKLDSLPAKKKQRITSLGRLFRETSVINLKTAADQIDEKENHSFRLRIAPILAGAVISVLLFIILLSTTTMNSNALLGIIMTPLALGGALGVGPIIFQAIMQSLYQRQADIIARQIENDPILDSTMPLLVAMRTTSYIQPATTSPIIEEAVVDTEEKFIPVIDFSESPAAITSSPTSDEVAIDIKAQEKFIDEKDFPEVVPTHQPSLAKKTSPTMFSRKVEEKEVKEVKKATLDM